MKLALEVALISKNTIIIKSNPKARPAWWELNELELYYSSTLVETIRQQSACIAILVRLYVQTVSYHNTKLSRLNNT